MMIVGNKIDLPSEVPAQQVKAFAEKHNCLFMETSAKTGTNVQEAFERLCDACVGHIGQLYEFKDDNAIMLNKGESRSWCCSH
jgi:hypothetical protein